MMTQNNMPDLCIIGAGAAGLSVAAGAAQMGAHVLLIEKGAMGGECLNFGCVPSKAILAAAHAAHGARTAKRFGVSTQEVLIDYAAVHAHIHRVIAAIAPVDSQERFEGLGCEVVRAEARFIAQDALEVAGRTIRAKRFVIATGSNPLVPPIPGINDVPFLTNETIFTLQTAPEHLLIIGGGPIGCELAQAHVRLGCKVTLVERGPIMPRDDSEAVAIVRQSLAEDGVNVVENAHVVQVKNSPLTLVLDDGRTIMGSHLLVATGRAARTQGYGLEAAGVAYTQAGIQVDARLRTSNKRIYALGDCRDGPRFTHAAGAEAGVVIQNALFRLPAKVNWHALPWVTFTDPELAQVGMTHAQAMQKYGAEQVQILHWPFHENDRAQAEGRTHGFVKVVTNKGRVVGATIVGPCAGELIQSWTLAITQKLGLGALARLIAPYPTFAEVNKRAAGSAYTKALFSPRVRALVRLLLRLP
jgi:pyruvate/2-oxoglutarate dehydrogenase complex dihydrolipoamide dehydrogenase (E3) component